MTTFLRVSQEVLEPLVIGTVHVRVSQEILEVQARGSPAVRASQLVGEPLARGTPNVRASQLVTEPILRGTPHCRPSQFVLEVLCLFLEMPMPPVYPQLIGLGYDVTWSPGFMNMPTATSTSGADIDLGLAEWPLHDFELTYNFLRDAFISGTQEFKTMFAFYLQMGGTVGRFLFPNPDDNKTEGEPIGTGDGTTTVFGPLMRTFGVGEYTDTEPIGWLDLTQPFTVYFNGEAVDASAYEILQVGGCNMQIKFNTPPSDDVVITGDYSYYYYCKFPTNTNTFNKFLDHIWAVKKVMIHSCRAGA